MMDSGFCVAAGIITLHKHRVFGQLHIKKHGQYWPKSIPGNAIDTYFAEKDLDKMMIFKQQMDSIDFLVHCTKDANYVIKIMSLHGMLDEIQNHPTGHQIGRVWWLFKYLEPILGHNHAKHWVDDHNNRRHAPIGLDQMWKTKWWPTRQFAFLVGIVDVNEINMQALDLMSQQRHS